MGKIHYLLLPIGICIGGIIISIGLYFFLVNVEREREKDHFKDMVKSSIYTIRKETSVLLASLQSLQAFSEISWPLSKDTFCTLAENAMLRQAAIQGISLNIKVPFDQIKEFEELLSKEHQKEKQNFFIFEKNAEGQRIPVNKRDAYYPILYTVPYKGNEVAIGFDIGSESTRLHTVQKAIRTHEAALTARVSLVQIKDKQWGTLLMLPIYTSMNFLDALSSSVSSTKLSSSIPRQYHGHITGIIRADILVGFAFANYNDIDIFVFDTQASEDRQLLYSRSNRLDKDSQAIVDPQTMRQGVSLSAEETIIVADRPWRIVIQSSIDDTILFLWQPFIISFTLFLITCLTSYLFVLLHLRKQEIAKSERLSRELVKLARQAGMAEIANHVLHNIGNILNSINTSIAVLLKKIAESKMSGLKKACELIQNNLSTIGDFLTKDSRGQHLPNYLTSLSDYWDTEKEGLLNEINSLRDYVENVNRVVAAQNSISGSTLVEEKISLKEICDEALDLSGIEIEKIILKKSYSSVSEIYADRLKLTKILINLLTYAKNSLKQSAVEVKKVSLEYVQTDSVLQVIIMDNSGRLLDKNLTDIFSQSFINNKVEYGNDLHSSSVMAKEMSGSLIAKTEGVDNKIAFVLTIPYKTSS